MTLINIDVTELHWLCYDFSYTKLQLLLKKMLQKNQMLKINGNLGTFSLVSR